MLCSCHNIFTCNVFHHQTGQTTKQSIKFPESPTTPSPSPLPIPHHQHQDHSIKDQIIFDINSDIDSDIDRDINRDINSDIDSDIDSDTDRQRHAVDGLHRNQGQQRLKSKMQSTVKAGREPSYRAAAESHNISKTTLLATVNGRGTYKEAREHSRALSPAQVEALIKWIERLYVWRFPATRHG